MEYSLGLKPQAILRCNFGAKNIYLGGDVIIHKNIDGTILIKLPRFNRKPLI